MLSLQQILRNVENMPWDHGLFLSFDNKWTMSTSCLVLDLNECDEDDRHPEANAHGFEYAIRMQEVQDIVRNAKQQVRDPSDTQLLELFLYYYDNDAFLNFASSKGRELRTISVRLCNTRVSPKASVKIGGK